MKAKITRPDGTIIELDGDPVHVQAAIAQLSPPPWPAFMGVNVGAVPIAPLQPLPGTALGTPLY